MKKDYVDYVILEGKLYLLKEGIYCKGCYFADPIRRCSNTMTKDDNGDRYNCHNENLILVEDTSETYINF